MANAKSKAGRRFALIAVLLVAAGLAALWFGPQGERLRSDSAVATAYMARVACSCHFAAGRSMEDCAKDRMAGMELVSLSADEGSRSVTARIPLLASDMARYREGYGCVLQSWRAREG